MPSGSAGNLAEKLLALDLEWSYMGELCYIARHEGIKYTIEDDFMNGIKFSIDDGCVQQFIYAEDIFLKLWKTVYANSKGEIMKIVLLDELYDK